MSDTADTIKGPETDLPGKASLRQRVRLEDCYTWQCTDCPTVLATLQELKDHHHLVHDQAVHFQCVECAKVYTVYKKFTRHVRLHRNHGNYRCLTTLRSLFLAWLMVVRHDQTSLLLKV